MSEAALLALAALDGLNAAMKFVNGQIAASRERGEWTPEEEAAIDAKAEEVFAQPHWKRTD